ncbi:MAG: flagellar hook-associated protein FlgK [Paracoccaceae bacterium]
MSVTAALSNALSGLTAASRGAEVVSANVANARTEGYARRELNLSARSLGGNGSGVQIDGITRAVDQSLLNDRRIAVSARDATAIRADFFAAMENAIGLPGETGALTTRVDTLETALVEAASRPDSTARLENVLTAAQRLTDQVNGISATIQQARTEADREIGVQVTQLNTTLGRVAELNYEIRVQTGASRDATGLMDQRQQLIDQISGIVPVREVAREHGQIALFTTGGAVLLEGRPAEVGFSAAHVVTADMTVASGGLSGITVSGNAVSSPAQGGPLGGGSLGALFALRDDLAVTAQGNLDAFARDLTERLQSPDLTAGGTIAGLFTDQGARFDPAEETALSARLAINAAVDPAKGGALWKLRAGLDATAPGDAGDATVISALALALSRQQAPASGSLTGDRRSASALAADLLSHVGTARQGAEDDEAFAAARFETLRDLEAQSGVDTDAELQTMLAIEQAFAANARVISTVDDMIQTLIGIT